MEVTCDGCAACCLDWRGLVDDPPDPERVDDAPPLDDSYHLVPLTRDDVSGLVQAGYADALRPRLWGAPADRPSVEIDGYDVISIAGYPLFMIGLRQVEKPVAPFGTDPHWLPSCAFLDPGTLQCRIHDDEIYPTACAAYPGQHLALEVETMCERVEQYWDQERLLGAEQDTAVPPPPFGVQALGSTAFLHQNPDRLTGSVERLIADDLTAEDRAEFTAVALSQSPGMPLGKEPTQERLDRIAETRSWITAAITDWKRLAEGAPPEATLGEAIETDRGAPRTPGW